MGFLVDVSVALMGLGVLVAVYGRRTGRLSRAVSNTPVTAVADVTEPGPVAVHGTATKSGTFSNRAPFSPTTYLVAPWAVQRYGDDDAGSAWHTLESGHEAVPFTLEDDTGEISVDLTGDADLHVDIDELAEKHRVHPDERQPRAVETFELKNDDVDPQTEGAASALKVGTMKDIRRYMEGVVTVDDECYLLGETEWRTDESDADGDSRELVVAASDDHPSKLSLKEPDAVRDRFNWGSLYVALGVLIAAGGAYLNLVANGVL